MPLLSGDGSLIRRCCEGPALPGRTLQVRDNQGDRAGTLLADPSSPSALPTAFPDSGWLVLEERESEKG